MDSIFANAPVNTGRQFEVDMVRVLAIATMVLVHCFEWLYPQMENFPDWLTLLIEFAGGPLSAPLFMTAMGISLVYSRKQSPVLFARRGLRLFGQGYLLNFLRAGSLYWLLYLLLGEAEYLDLAQGGMLALDILQFAGLTFLLFALLRRIGAKPIHVAGLSLLMLVVATLVKPLQTESVFLQFLAGHFLYQNEHSFFPLFSWFIFPAAGYCFAIFLQCSTNKSRLYGRILLISAVLFAIYTTALALSGYGVLDIFLTDAYYPQNIVSAPWILLIAAMTYACLFYLSQGIKAAPVRALLSYISSKVNALFMVQWVLIVWLYELVFSRFSISTLLFFLLTGGILALSLGLVYAWDRFSAKRRSLAQP